MKLFFRSHIVRDKEDIFLEHYIDLYYDGVLRVLTIDHFPLQTKPSTAKQPIPKNWIVIAGCEPDEDVLM